MHLRLLFLVKITIIVEDNPLNGFLRLDQYKRDQYVRQGAWTLVEPGASFSLDLTNKPGESL